MKTFMVSILGLLLVSSVGLADDDLEFYFKQKSTLDNFPLKEIGQEELSEAVIEGALQASSAGSIGNTGKPAYAEQKDIDEKRSKSELKAEINGPKLDDILKFSQNIPEIPQIPQQPFEIPNGRTYAGHSFNAVEH